MDSTPPVAGPVRHELSPARLRDLVAFFAVGLVAGFVGGGIGCAIVVAAFHAVGRL